MYSGSFRGRAGSRREPLAKTKPRRKQRPLHLLRWDFKQLRDGCGRVAFDIAQKEEQPFTGRKALQRNLKVGPANITLSQACVLRDDCGRLLLSQRKPFAEFTDQRRIDHKSIRLLAMLKNVNEGIGEDFFRLQFIAGHVKGQSKCTVTMALKNVPLALLRRLLSRLGSDETGLVL